MWIEITRWLVIIFLSGVGLLIGLTALISLLTPAPNPNEFYWVDKEPWKCCPDCKGTGKIKLDDNTSVRCHCACELKGPYDR